MKTIYLISCVKRKQKTRCKAKDIYISDLFSKAKEYVQQRNASWYILSAKHGVLDPETEIDPYDETLNNMSKWSRKKWADEVIRVLFVMLLQPGDTVVMLAGNNYREFLLPAMEHMGVKVEIPMKGLKIGEQLSWLKRNAIPSSRGII